MTDDNGDDESDYQSPTAPDLSRGILNIGAIIADAAVASHTTGGP